MWRTVPESNWLSRAGNVLQTSALPFGQRSIFLVGSVGIEPTTFTLRGCCYYQLSYEPLFLVEAERIELS